MYFILSVVAPSLNEWFKKVLNNNSNNNNKKKTPSFKAQMTHTNFFYSCEK